MIGVVSVLPNVRTLKHSEGKLSVGIGARRGRRGRDGDRTRPCCQSSILVPAIPVVLTCVEIATPDTTLGQHRADSSASGEGDRRGAQAVTPDCRCRRRYRHGLPLLAEEQRKKRASHASRAKSRREASAENGGESRSTDFSQEREFGAGWRDERVRETCHTMLPFSAADKMT